MQTPKMCFAPAAFLHAIFRTPVCKKHKDHNVERDMTLVEGSTNMIGCGKGSPYVKIGAG